MNLTDYDHSEQTGWIRSYKYYTGLIKIADYRISLTLPIKSNPVYLGSTNKNPPDISFLTSEGHNYYIILYKRF